MAEAFLQPDPSRERYYREFEVSPNGMWIDLDIFPGGLADLKSGLKKSVVLDEDGHRWAAELAIPIESAYPELRSERDLAGQFLSGRGKEKSRELTWRGRPPVQRSRIFMSPARLGSCGLRSRG